MLSLQPILCYTWINSYNVAISQSPKMQQLSDEVIYIQEIIPHPHYDPKAVYDLHGSSGHRPYSLLMLSEILFNLSLFLLLKLQSPHL